MATFPVHLLKKDNKEKKKPVEDWQNLPASNLPTKAKNWGITLSRAYLVIDVDIKNGKKGKESWDRMQTLLKRPLTNAVYTVQTPSGGLHIWFNLPSNFKVRKNNPAFPDIDFLSKGAYVVGPGTYFKNSKYPYPYKVIQGEFDPEWDFHLDISVPPLPEEWYSIVGQFESQHSRELESKAFDFWDAPHVIQAFSQELKTCKPAIEYQNGNIMTYETALMGRDYGLHEDTTLGLMLKHYNPRCQPPWQEDEMAEIVRNAYQYATGQIGKENYLNYLDDMEDEEPIGQDNSTIMNTNTSSTNTLSLIPHKRASDIKPKPIDWLWEGRIARGKLTILAGHPGLGKSQITANFAATVSNADVWPDQTKIKNWGRVVFLSSEDEPDDTIVPRLMAAGANLEKIEFLSNLIPKHGSVNLRDHTQELECTLAQIDNVALLVIDPIMAYLGGIDSHKNADVRALLVPLSEMASRLKVAILAVSHLNKTKGGEAMMRITGSGAFIAAARAGFLVAEHPEKENTRVLLPLKNNIGPDRGGFSYTIESASVTCEEMDIGTSRIIWSDEPITLTANEALAASTEDGKGSALDDAKAFLEEALSNGPRLGLEVQEEAKSIGISLQTLKRAKKELKIQHPRNGYQGKVLWALANDYSSYLFNEPIVAQEEV